MSVADVLEYLAADHASKKSLPIFPIWNERTFGMLAYAAERERERGSTPLPA